MYNVRKSVAVRGIAYLLVVLLTGFTTAGDRVADLKTILTKVVNDKNTAFFLDRYIRDRGVLFFRYEELPVYNSVPLPKPRFNLPYKNGKVISFNLNMTIEHNNPVLIIESIIITHDEAVVNYRVPYGFIFGEYRLHRSQAGEWVITKADVSET